MRDTLPPNELYSELLGSDCLNNFPGEVSSPRGQMFASSHLSQMLVINGSTSRSIQTGMERKYAPYTFKIEMPADGKILNIIERYPHQLGRDTIGYNPQTVLIYEDVNTNEVGIVNLVDYRSEHQYMGFRYVDGPGMAQIAIGALIKKGTVFRHSPSVTEDGEYKYGIQSNVAYMSVPGVAEDGVVVSESFVKKMRFNIFETRVIEWGEHEFALNIYGDEDNYKPFPDIGGIIGEHNLVMATRSLEPIELALVERSVKDCMEVDYTFDNLVYAAGPGGLVIDVRIEHDFKNRNIAEVHMDGQAQKYDDARRVFYKQILDVYNRLNRNKGESLQITHEFSSMLKDAYAVVFEQSKEVPRGQEKEKKSNVQKQHRGVPLDIYRVEVVIQYEITPNIGFKLSDCFGGLLVRNC